MRRSFVVSFELPKSATEDDAVDYICEAVEAWRGSLHPPGLDGGGERDDNEPGHPMWSLDPTTIKVVPMRIYARGGE